MFDFVIVGSGFAGSVVAERIANVLNKKVLLIEKRAHIGGNCYDYYDKNGILIHKYGPHIFHTNDKKVWEYLANFTDWRIYQHKVLAFIDEKKVPLPFNLNTLHALLPYSIAERLEKKLIEHFGFGNKVPILELKMNEDKDLKFLAEFIYEKVFLNYTLKQWGMRPEELSPEVTGRVPVFISRDDRYFQDKYQGIPAEGYTKLFERMLSHPNIKILLNTDAKEVLKVNFESKKIFFMEKEYEGKIIFTGPIDELMNYKYGELPYRSLRFKFETYDKEYFQEVAVVNYPNNYEFTRITEFKHLTGQIHPKTVIAKEYPIQYNRNIPGRDIPYYPVPNQTSAKIFEQYLREIEQFGKIYLVGRLAKYKYYSMEKVVEDAIMLFEEKLK